MALRRAHRTTGGVESTKLSLRTEVAGLGLAAVDAIGIAFMPILLAQANGLRRALVFLLGSFLALMTVGLLFTTGFGSRIAEVNERHPWLEPGVQIVGGVVLFGAGIFMLVRSRKGGSHAPDDLVEKLSLPMPLLFGFGVVLVTVQSLVDAVFAVAMVEIGAQGLSFFENYVLVLTYTLCALLLRAAVVVGYLLFPQGRRVHVMAGFTDWLTNRGEFWAGIAGLLVGDPLLIHSVPVLAGELTSETGDLLPTIDVGTPLEGSRPETILLTVAVRHCLSAIGVSAWISWTAKDARFHPAPGPTPVLGSRCRLARSMT